MSFDGNTTDAAAKAAADLGIELTLFAKESQDPLSKRITLDHTGKPVSDGSRCVMQSGAARRCPIGSLDELRGLLHGLPTHLAVALGALRPDLPDMVAVTTKAAMPGDAPPDLIARTGEFLGYRPGKPAFGLIDFDRKGMPAEVNARINAAGGAYFALLSVLPELDTAATVGRRSTSTGLYRTDTGERFPDAGGTHLYIVVKDGADIPRFLAALHHRCWLAGFGWHMIGQGGQLLERSIVDKSVCAPERLVFEGAPELVPPLAQDRGAPLAKPGDVLDTLAVCPDLTAAEMAQLDQMLAASRHALKPDIARAKEAFVCRQVAEITTRTGMSSAMARRVAEQQTEGVLLPDVLLDFDAEGRVPVAYVLANPERYIGATLADPLEGVAYGRCKAKVLRRPDDSLMVHSFAHGRTTYELRYDGSTIGRAIAAAAAQEVPSLLADMLLLASITPDDEQALVEQSAKASGIGVRVLKARIKGARERREETARRARRDADAARETRRIMAAPGEKDERLPVTKAIDAVLAASTDPFPPMRNEDNELIEVRVRQPRGMYALRSEAEKEADGSRLPPPVIPLLTLHDQVSTEHMIERHICFMGENGPLAIDDVFVRSFAKYRDSKLPVGRTIVTAPVVQADGTLLSPVGLDRQTGVVYCIPKELRQYLPDAAQCDDEAVRNAIRFLIDEWLCDVATDFSGKFVLIAIALSIIERTQMDERPAYIVTAGRRGGGKTTALRMVVLAATGKMPPAVAWSPDKEERRKALHSYLLEGVSALVWDNIPRGYQISCPHIEAALTSPEKTDRTLGKTEHTTASTASVMAFNGNNIGARGDMASRSLTVRIDTDRPDPENRAFRHPDPIAWTEEHRGEILRALYTVLLANPQLRCSGYPDRAIGRFKAWWKVVGSALEHAASLTGGELDFGRMFAEQDAEDEDTVATSNIVDALRDMGVEAGTEFSAAEVTDFINGCEDRHEARRTLRELLAPNSVNRNGGTSPAYKAQVGTNLKNLIGSPVLIDKEIWVVKGKYNAHRKQWGFHLAMKTLD